MATSPSAAFLGLRAFIQTAAMECPLPGEVSGRQNGVMTATTASKPIEPRLAGMVAGIRQLIPAADVRLYSCGEACGYGSRARGDGQADSDVDLLITVPDAWLAQRDRFALLDPFGCGLILLDRSHSSGFKQTSAAPAAPPTTP
jgi:hypothetical protein